MTEKQDLESFLKANGIDDVSVPDMDERKYLIIKSICSQLGWSLFNKDNLKILIPIVQAQPMEGFLCPRAESLLQNIQSLKQGGALTQDTFIVLCNFISEREVINQSLVKCFKSMKKKELLAKKNIQDILNKIGTIPKAQQITHIIQLSWYLDSSWMNTEYFHLLMQNYCLEINYLRTCINSVHNEYSNEFHTVANCQALIDCYPYSVAKADDSLNARLLDGCSEKLKVLETLSLHRSHEAKTIKAVPNKKIIEKHLAGIHSKLLHITNQPEHQADPRKILHLVAVILKALPFENHQPQPADITKLMALGREAQGHPSPLWQAVGFCIMLLAAAISLVGPGLAVGTVTAVIGLGLFAYGRRRAGLSKDVMNLVAEVSSKAT